MVARHKKEYNAKNARKDEAAEKLPRLFAPFYPKEKANNDVLLVNLNVP
jgi:hypothetical protein